MILVSWRPRVFQCNTNSRISPATSLSWLNCVVSHRACKKVATSLYKFLFTGKKNLGLFVWWWIDWLVGVILHAPKIDHEQRTDWQTSAEWKQQLGTKQFHTPFISFWYQPKWKLKENSQECLQNLFVFCSLRSGCMYNQAWRQLFFMLFISFL